MEDLHSISAMHRESILGLCAAHYSALELSQWTDSLRPEKYVALFAGREFFVAEEDGEILGFGVLDPKESLINATYVSPKTVRRGIGRGLVETMENAARQAGVSQLHLSSTLNAVAFYERLGFVQVKAASNRLPTGVELPCVTMTKDLKE
jgi:GNAT superfamily N-acetyltransferase